MSFDRMRVERAGQLGMSVAIHKGAETMEEITHQTLKRALPVIAEEFARLVMGPSEELLDAATCRHIAQMLREVVKE